MKDSPPTLQGLVTRENQVKDYDSEKLRKLLEHYLEASKRCIDISNALSTHQDLIEYLGRLPSRQIKTYLLLLNIDAVSGEFGAHFAHCVGLYIKSLGLRIEITYADPMGKPISENLKKLLITHFSKSTNSRILVESPTLYKDLQYVRYDYNENTFKGNTNDCYPILIYALSCIANDLPLLKVEDESESKELGYNLRDSFDKKLNFASIYINLNKAKYPIKLTKLNYCIQGSFNDQIKELETKLSEEFNLNCLQLPEIEMTKGNIIQDIKESYAKALKFFKEHNLQKAQQEFVKVIKPVLSNPALKDKYVDVKDISSQVLDSMYHLGLIHLDSEWSYYNSYAKAAAIFQFCSRFAKIYGVEGATDKVEEYLNTAYKVEEIFLASIGKGNNKVGIDRIKKYKLELQELREVVSQYVNEIQNWKIEKVKDRVQEIEEIFKKCTRFFVNNDRDKMIKPGLVQKLIKDCIKQLGGIPKKCQYAIISFGSLAVGQMTPWSDLEFAILINKNNEKFKEYFRNLTKLLHIKIINFGETPLRSLGIEVLNNFRTGNKKDDWFWDNITNNGFCFDGPDWYSCKTPLGRQGNYKGKKNFELILTPRKMANFQKEAPKESKTKNWAKSDLCLVQTLRLTSLIEGSQHLLDSYREELKNAANTVIVKRRAIEKLTQDLGSFSLKLTREQEGKLINVKEDIFRIGDRIVGDLANYYQITAGKKKSGLTVWEVINEMSERWIISKEGAQHLKEAIVIAAALRLATYCHNKGQKESFSTYQPAIEHLNNEEKKKFLEETFYIKDTSILHHFYYIITPLQGSLNKFCKETSRKGVEAILKSSRLLAHNSYIKALVHARFMEYDMALKYMKLAEQEHPEDINILESLFILHNKIGDSEESVRLSHRLLDQIKIRHEGDTDWHALATCYSYLAVSYAARGEYEEAIRYHEQTLSIMLKLPPHLLKHQSIAINYSNLGSIYSNIGKYKEAIWYHQKSLAIMLEVCKNDHTHPDLALIYSKLGTAYINNTEYEKAALYCYYELKLKLKMYKDIPNHPALATCYDNMATVCNYKKQYMEALRYYNYALAIKHKIYKDIPNHSDIATSYNNLGDTYLHTEEYEEAIKSYQQAYAMKRKIYVDNPYHPALAPCYNNLGVAHYRNGEYQKAVKYYMESIRVLVEAYKCNPDHPNFDITFYNIKLANLHLAAHKQGVMLTLDNIPSMSQFLEFLKMPMKPQIAQESGSINKELVTETEPLGNNEISYNL